MFIFVADNNVKMYHMKKAYLLLLVMLALGFNLKAQLYVSTEPANRNVILEDFTGRNCGYCPAGHLIANTIMENNPERVWAVNIHAGIYAPTSYPNFITSDGNTIHGGFSISGYPSGVANRSTATGQGRNAWTSLCNAQLSQAAECNIAGRANINIETRVVTITVEVYYTGNSIAAENYLTVAMLQDSIMGSQNGMNDNPSQMVNGQYCHMHVLRDIITESAWGEAISPTTQGTLITKTYEYAIPESIGSPNGVDVVLDHIFFLAWVSERFQGTPARPILNACELVTTIVTNEPIYPMVDAVNQRVEASCSLEKNFGFLLTNIGTEVLTSVKFNAQVADAVHEFEWTGELPSGESDKVDFSMEIPFGSYTGALSITEANGSAYERTVHFTADSQEWPVVTTDGESVNLKIFIVQDQYGEQTTWNIINSMGEQVASGGPYQHLATSATSIHMENVNGLPANECYLFRIFDSNNDGMCCNFGNGYYVVKDASGAVIFGDNDDGNFGSEARHLISVVGASAVTVTTEEPRLLSSHEALFIGTVSDATVEVGFEYKKLVDPTPFTVVGELNGNTFTAIVDDLEPNTMYSVKAFALVNGEKVYGNERHFHTTIDGIGELENALKVYPNPANDYLTVEGRMTSVEVYNTVGQRLIVQEVNDAIAQINLSGLGNGIYFLRVCNNGETVVRRFSVNR